ncbi:MAG: SDR family oxidoreductase [Chlamydiales bacterium]|nr:SDR family oxidoreductase [Chlamydiales bacterium]
MMNFTLHKKNLLITGGSMGLGLASARACLEKGANVVICARTKSDIELALETLRKEGFSSIKGCVADVTKETDIESILDALESHFGALHGVIHAAGVYGPIGPITEVDPSAWLEGVKINLFGSFIVMRQSCLRLKKHQGGRLVLFSGGGAASSFPNYSSYASAKAAVVRLTETIAQEMAPYRIEANCIAPGFVLTRLHQKTLEADQKAGLEFLEKTKKELAQGGIPAEIGASAAAFLVSDAAQGISGKFISAPYDHWKDFLNHLKELKETDIFTLRRIVPKDRGMSWQ